MADNDYDSYLLHYNSYLLKEVQMTKRSLPLNSKNMSRLSKRAKVTNLKEFFSVKSAPKSDQVTKSASSKKTSVVPESSTTSTHIPEIAVVPCPDEPDEPDETDEPSDVQIAAVSSMVTTLEVDDESSHGDRDIFPLKL